MARPPDIHAATPAPPLGGAAAELADRRAVALARAGHPEAFEELVRRHRAGLRSLCSRLLHDGLMGEDLTQEAFARAYSRLGSFRGEGSVRRWLYQIATNGCLDFLRSGGRSERPAAIAGEALWTLRDPERDTAARQALEALDAAVASLPPACRQALLLHSLENLSYAQVSEVTGVAVSALKVRVHRARAILRRRLGERPARRGLSVR